MPLDPQVERFIRDTLASEPPNPQKSVAEAREGLRSRSALMASKPQPVARVENRHIPGPGGQLPIRIYWPSGEGPSPILVFFHGGGWVVGDLSTHDSLCRSFTRLANCITVAVDYRLAPEHKYPAAVRDCYAATSWVSANASALGADPRRIAVGGDSAGGTLAVAIALLSKERGWPEIALQLLICPVLDRPFDTRSWKVNGEGYLLTRNDMEWYWNHYLSSEAEAKLPYVSPLRAGDLSGLPSALVITAEFDPLRDEGEAFVGRLRNAGVPVRLAHYKGLIHSFPVLDGVLDRGRKAVEEIAGLLRQSLGPGKVTVP